MRFSGSGYGLVAILFMAGIGPSGAADAGALRQALPQAMQDRIAADPAGFQKKLAFLAGRYGADGNLSAAAFDRMVAVVRAQIRASETARLMAADLDADGSVSQAERDAVKATLSTVRQKKLDAAWVAADADKDGSVSAAELMDHAQASALRSMSDARADGWRALLGLDGDGDGLLTPAEIDAALAGVVARAPAKAAASGAAAAEPDAADTAAGG